MGDNNSEINDAPEVPLPTDPHLYNFAQKKEARSPLKRNGPGSYRTHDDRFQVDYFPNEPGPNTGYMGDHWTITDRHAPDVDLGWEPYTRLGDAAADLWSFYNEPEQWDHYHSLVDKHKKFDQEMDEAFGSNE